MNYKKDMLKQGINLHLLKNNKFKTNLLSVFITVPLDKETLTKNALIAAVLRRGTMRMPTQEEISKNLENMYGASFDCGVEKSGDNHIIKFYLECLDDELLPGNDKILDNCINTLLEIVFDPVIRNGHFLQEYVEGEKENLKQIIESKIDNKNKYALDRCIEEMYKNKPYGLYKYGYIEDLEAIDAKALYEYYKELIKTAKIDIFISGNVKDEIVYEIKDNSIIKQLSERNSKYVINDDCNDLDDNAQTKVVTENMQVNQGKLILGLDITDCTKKYATSVYNIILGGSANSKLFQNVREKASLAYTASSSYIRVKNNIIVKCGIEIENYEKALNIIKEQLEQIKNGDFTDDDIENSKKLIISTVGSISDSQDSEITYYFGQELSKEFVSIEDYIKNINAVNRKDIEFIANKININTIYFLRN